VSQSASSEDNFEDCEEVCEEACEEVGYILQTSVADPLQFGTNQDPQIHT
jgi:hypothetical protein